MVGVSAAPSRSWSHGRAIDHFRCLPRPHGERGRVPARGAMAALHGAFLSERLQPRADDQGPRGEPYAQGHPCPGEPGRGRPKGACDRRRLTCRQNEHGGRSGRAQRIRNADLIHWQKIRTNNPLERIMKEIRRRTRVVGAFPDGQSCLNLAAARLRYIAGTTWSAKCYMNMRPLYQPQVMQTEAVA